MDKKAIINKYAIAWEYKSLLALYDLTLLKAMQLAQDLEDGLILDELELAVILEELKSLRACMKQIRLESNLSLNEFDISEHITFPGCQLKNGRLEGEDFQKAKEAARNWVRNYNKNKERKDQYKYEAGLYLLLLCNEEVFF